MRAEGERRISDGFSHAGSCTQRHRSWSIQNYFTTTRIQLTGTSHRILNSYLLDSILTRNRKKKKRKRERSKRKKAEVEERKKKRKQKQLT